MGKIRWIQFSNLFFGSDNNSEIIEKRRELLRYIERLGQRFDYLFCVGNIKKWNSTFDENAVDYLIRLCEVAGVSKDRLFIVPGIQDIDLLNRKRTTIIKKYANNKGMYNAFLNGIVSDKDLSVFKESESDFLGFIQKLYGKDRADMYHAPYFVIKTDHFNILHLDSALTYIDHKQGFSSIIESLTEVLKQCDSYKPIIILSYLSSKDSSLIKHNYIYSVLKQYKAHLWLSGRSCSSRGCNAFYTDGFTEFTNTLGKGHNDSYREFIFTVEYDTETDKGLIKVHEWLNENYFKYWQKVDQAYGFPNVFMLNSSTIHQEVISLKINDIVIDINQRQNKEVKTGNTTSLPVAPIEKKNSIQIGAKSSEDRIINKEERVNSCRDDENLEFSKNVNLLVIIAAGWGYSHGGINVFNREMCRGLSYFISDQMRILCIAPDISQNEIDKVCRNERINLISVSKEEFEIASVIVDRVRSYCEHERITDPSIVWLGHDTYSDRQALGCRDNWKGSRCAIIHHMAYGIYYPLMNTDTDKSEEKERIQRERLSSADIVFANGPLLKKSAQDLCGRDDNVFEILPGVFNVKKIKKRTPNFFNVVSFGRIEPQSEYKRNNSIIKQIFLSVAAWAEFTRELRPSDNSTMKVYGKSDDKADNEFTKLIKKHTNKLNAFSLIPYETDHDKLLESLTDYSLCLVLSSKEGFGLTALEAISAGIPVIISESSGFYQALSEKLLEGYIYHLPIDGSLDEPYFSENDLRIVTSKIREVFDERERAKRRALKLREELINAGFKWETCAETILKKLGMIDDLNRNF